jgi:hypothetical protein
MQPTGAARTEITVTDLSLLVNTGLAGVTNYLGLTERGALGTPTLVGSWDQYQQVFGGLLATSDFPFYAKRALEGGAALMISRAAKYTDPTDNTTYTGTKSTYSLTQATHSATAATGTMTMTARSASVDGTCVITAMRPGASNVVLTGVSAVVIDHTASITTNTAAIATAINLGTGTHGYSATSSVGALTISTDVALGDFGNLLTFKQVSNAATTWDKFTATMTGGTNTTVNTGTLAISAHDIGAWGDNVTVTVTNAASNTPHFYDLTISCADSTLDDEVYKDFPQAANDAGWAAKVTAMLAASQMISAFTASANFVLTSVTIITVGIITSVDVTVSGNGYAVNDEFTIAGGTGGTGKVVTLQTGGGSGLTVNITSVSGGVITALNGTPTAGGSGYAVNDHVSIAVGVGGQALVTAVSGGAVTAVTLITGGSSGYTTGAGKATTEIVSTKVATVAILTGGTGYSTGTGVVTAHTSGSGNDALTIGILTVSGAALGANAMALASGADSDALDPLDYVGDSIGLTNLHSFDTDSTATKVAIPDIADPLLDYQLVAWAAARKDLIAIVRTPVGLQPQTNVDYRNGNGIYDHAKINDWHGIMSTGGLSVLDPLTGLRANKSEISDLVAAIAKKDNSSGAWYSFSGEERGVVSNAYGVVLNVGTPALSASNNLYDNNGLNPVIQNAAKTILFWGNSTLYADKSSLLAKAEVAELLVYLYRQLMAIVPKQTFNPNDPITWKTIYRNVKKLMDPLGSQRAVQGGEGKGWEYQGDQNVSNVSQAVINTPDSIASGKYIFKLFIAPVVALKYIQIDVVVTNSSVDFLPVV